MTYQETGQPSQKTSLWRPLRLFNLYRLALGILLMTLFHTKSEFFIVGSYHPRLFNAISLFYVLSAIFTVILIQLRNLNFNPLVYGLTATDILLLTLLIYSSGGLASGMGSLLLVSIAAAGMLVAGRMALLFAALASIAMLYQEGLLYLSVPDFYPRYFQAGVLGAGLFATALLAHVLAKRARESEALAAQRGVDLADMERLNQYIILHMQTGILVIDRAGMVRLMNDSAWRLLNQPKEYEHRPLSEISEPLLRRYQEWRRNPGVTTETFKSTETSPTVQPRFAALGRDDKSGTLIFLEDTARTAQQAQQMKLASLGRLTASIAHEIRNPLSAISHAGQLLAETETSTGNQRLTQIIGDNSQRMDRIIETVLTLSRRDRSQPELFRLQPWLDEFAVEFQRTQQLPDASIDISVEPANLEVRMDPEQLQQVLWNLCSNSLRHIPDNDAPRLELHAGISPGQGVPYLDIRDYGEGIDEESLEHLFEPFYTSHHQGTGLGLYIARELCESNRARLDYLPPEGPGASFRITFADPRRRQID